MISLDAKQNRRASTLLLVSAIVLAICGCHVHDNRTGQAENVQLRTPIGSLDVRTNAVHGPDVGLPVYPGAVETGKHGDDSGSADIHLSFGDWRLNVKAIEYQSPDPEDKIVTFYKEALGRYGDVLVCRDETAIGELSKTSRGLTCANNHEYEVSVRLDATKKRASAQSSPLSGNIKLLAGSPEDQHIIEFRPASSGTKFSIVVVQLPHKPQTD